METQKQDSRQQEAIEQILSSIIDEWYERVSGYYVTLQPENPNPDQEVELKRFHDAKGHRIKFNKEDLDFTYGLRSNWHGEHFAIEISVNNKVENFDYDDFRTQLLSHYARAGGERATQLSALQNVSLREIFQLEPVEDEAFTVEKRDDKADIMRLSFRITGDSLRILADQGEATKHLIEGYCVSPFRSVYAKVYRSTTF